MKSPIKVNERYSTVFEPDYICTFTVIREIGEMNDRIAKQPLDRLNKSLPQLLEQIDDMRQTLEQNDLLFYEENIYNKCISVTQAEEKLKNKGELCIECGKQLKKIMQCELCGQVFCKECCWRKRSLQNQKDVKTCCEICHRKFIKLLNNKQFLKDKQTLTRLADKVKIKGQKALQRIEEKQKYLQEYRQQKRNNKIKENQIQKSIQQQQKKMKQLQQQFKQIIIQKALRMKEIEQEKKIEQQKKKKQQQQKAHLQYLRQRELEKNKEIQRQLKRKEQQFNLKQKEQKQNQEKQFKQLKKRQKQLQIEKKRLEQQKAKRIKQEKYLQQLEKQRLEQQAQKKRRQQQKQQQSKYQQNRKSKQKNKIQKVTSYSETIEPNNQTKREKFGSIDTKKEISQTTQENLSYKQKGQLDHQKDESLMIQPHSSKTKDQSLIIQAHCSKINRNSNQKYDHQQSVGNHELNINQMSQAVLLGIKLPDQHRKRKLAKKQSMNNSELTHRSYQQKKQVIKIPQTQKQQSINEKRSQILKESIISESNHSIVSKSDQSIIRKDDSSIISKGNHQSVHQGQQQQSADPQKCKCSVM